MKNQKRYENELPPTLEKGYVNLADCRIVDKRPSRVSLPPLDQICIVVEDIDNAVDFYGSVFGLGPFYVTETESREGVVNGKKHRYRLKLAFALSGLIEIELIQVLEGNTIHTDFLKKKGEGIHHLRFTVGDIEGMLEELSKDGIEPVMGREHFALLNSDKVGGAIFELLQAK
ncbi:VOC family protein [Chloroflexota bacterium]